MRSRFSFREEMEKKMKRDEKMGVREDRREDEKGWKRR